MEEYWIEINITSTKLSIEALVQKIITPLVKMSGQRPWHFLYEENWRNKDRLPHIRYRVQTTNEEDRHSLMKEIEQYLRTKPKFQLGWYFGRHGIEGERYTGEVDRFGKLGWPLAKNFLDSCSKISLDIINGKKYGPRFHREDFIHLLANIFLRRDMGFETPCRMIFLAKDDASEFKG